MKKQNRIYTLPLEHKPQKEEHRIPYDLSRFHKAQRADYAEALAEIRAGHKRSHWIWYIFPQIQGLGFSSTWQYYAKQKMPKAVALGVFLRKNKIWSRF